MLKKLLAIVIAAQIAVSPVSAQTLPPMTPKQTKEFCKGFVGLDDVLFWGWIFSMATHVGITYLQNEMRRQEIEKLKAEAKNRCGAN